MQAARAALYHAVRPPEAVLAAPTVHHGRQVRRDPAQGLRHVEPAPEGPGYHHESVPSSLRISA